MILQQTDIMPSSPGSFNDFVGQNPELSRNEAVEKHTKALSTYREFIAKVLGVDTNDLHEVRAQIASENQESGELIEV